MGKYSNCRQVWKRVPVQYGNLSARKRHCYDLGSTDWEVEGVKWHAHYYRIHEYEIGAGRIWGHFEWKDKDGVWWEKEYYLAYRDLPYEIKYEIKEGIKQEE